MNWETVETERLFEAIRERGPASDAERTVWAFERASLGRPTPRL